MTKVLDPIHTQMIDTVETLAHEIQALSRERTKQNRRARAFKEKYSHKVEITKGPDRGYLEVVWRSPELRFEYETQWDAPPQELTAKIDSHRNAIRAMEKWLKENN